MVSDLQITIYQRNVIENITNFIRLNIFVALKYSSVQIPSYIYIYTLTYKITFKILIQC